MAKYGYDRSKLKGLTPFPFLGEVKTRNKHIEAADTALPQSVFNPNRLADALHPVVQYAKVAEVVDHGDAKSYVLVPDAAKGTKALAYFRAGQYVSVSLDMDGVTADKPYTLSSAPKAALGSEHTSYTLTVKQAPGSDGATHILGHWQEGTEVTLSGPKGEFYYQEMRDARHVLALAGGSGITPFLSMAAAVADGTEDFRLTVLYGSRTKDGILLKEELDALEAKSKGKVRVVHVLSDETAEGYEHGFITAELIRKYAEGDTSVFVCGPRAMYGFVKAELKKLPIPERRIRFELSGEFGDPSRAAGYPAEAAGKTHSITVWIRGEKRVVPCKAEQSLLRAMEQAGIRVPSDCRSGQCGWCHSRLIAGDVFVPEEADGRRMADKQYGWIHPCATYALTDVELEVFPIL
ncbi:MAG: 2Fe-2S iron-sulfur cluster-binding protein [Clostridia bacterium]|nr:2Fe-2S iron-sulfur cluster-binding protein [Clostridia bacterium]